MLIGKLDNSMLAWIWAANEQIRMLDQHDAKWLKQAQTKDWPDEDFWSFLGKYGLIRGDAGKFVFSKANATNRQCFHKICENVFFEPLPTALPWEELSERWLAVLKTVQCNFEQKNSFT
ncbi:MAG: hypothetical protein COC08_04030, partial [Maribacter sp.]